MLSTSSEQSTSSTEPSPSRQSGLLRGGSTTPSSTTTRKTLSSRPPQPPADHAAVYLTVSEFDRADEMPEPGVSRLAMRHCSIAIQLDSHIKEFTIHYLRGAPGPGNQIELYTVKKCPNPRWGEPGLLAMDFLGFIPHQRARELDVLVTRVGQAVSRSYAAWNSRSWVLECFGKMLEAGLVTNRQVLKATEKLDRALHLPYTGDYPNGQDCFGRLE